MKKYLASLIPFLVCTGLSFVYGVKTPRNFPDPSYPYQTKGTLAYLSMTWFYIGIIISGIFISMFVIGDIFDWLAKATQRKREKMGSVGGRGQF